MVSNFYLYLDVFLDLNFPPLPSYPGWFLPPFRARGCVAAWPLWGGNWLGGGGAFCLEGPSSSSWQESVGEGQWQSLVFTQDVLYILEIASGNIQGFAST